MNYTFKDIITGAELSEENFMRCLDGYLDTVKEIDKDVTQILLLYIDRALELGGDDLATIIIGRIMADLYCQYD